MSCYHGSQSYPDLSEATNRISTLTYGLFLHATSSSIMVLKPQQQSGLRPVPTWFEQLNRPPVPYFKNVSIEMLKPQQFGLDKWGRYFVIPDKWMRKIYEDEVYYDTDLPKKEEPASLTNEEKKLLYDWLTDESPFRFRTTKKPTSKPSRRTSGPSTDLVGVLEAAKDSDQDSEDLADDDSDDSDIYDPKRVASLIGHRYQPEHMIVRKAVQSMRQLSQEQNDYVENAMKDSHLMRMIHEKVSAHLGKSSDGYAI